MVTDGFICDFSVISVYKILAVGSLVSHKYNLSIIAEREVRQIS